MKTENPILMKMARESLAGKWGLAIGTFVVYFIIIFSLQSISKFNPFINVFSLLIAGPFALGMATFSLNISRNQDARIEQIFNGFNKFGIALSAYLWMLLYIILWLLCLIIPGIIAAFSYSMTFFILADDPNMGPKEAIQKSKIIMEGNKWKLFNLGLRFFGWALLCILSLGIGFLWLIPYAQISMAKFYDDIKEKNAINESL